MLLWLAILGVVLLLISMYDIAWTTLSASESGTVSLIVMRSWKRLSRLFKKFPMVHRILRSIGLLTFLSTIIVWFLIFWAAWSLIFISVGDSVISSVTGASATGWQKIYFVGNMIFTAGLGDFKPKPDNVTYQMLTVFANGTGFILVTVTIAYLVSATDAVTKQRHLAGFISSLGDNPHEMITNAWNGENIRDIESELSRASAEITLCAQHLIRFPLIFNFHSIETFFSPAIKIAALHEMLVMSESYLPAGIGISRFVLRQCKKSIYQYLQALEIVSYEDTTRVKIPDAPKTDKLETEGIPLLSENYRRMNMGSQHIEMMRRHIYNMVKQSSRSWEDVYGAEAS